VDDAPQEPAAREPVSADPVSTEENPGPAASAASEESAPSGEQSALWPTAEPSGGGAVDVRGAIEAVLLVVDEPVTETLLAQTLDRPVAEVAATLAELAAEYTEAGRGFDLRRAAGGWRLYTRPEHAHHVERFVLEGQQARLTQAALETLAVIAYKQPVTRSRVSAIRGVNVDGVIRTLLTRRLVEECGTDSDTGGYLYRTTGLFLEKLGLDSLDELPALAPLLPGMDALDDVVAAS
jgi:segregation and condensation protein B